MTPSDDENVPAKEAKKRGKPFKIPGGIVSIAIVMAILCGLLLRNAPAGVQSLLIDELANPIRTAILSVIVGITCPMIFFSMLSGICAMDSTDKLTDLGNKVFRRFFMILLITGLVAIGFSMLFVSDISAGGGGALSVGEIVTLLMEIFPKDIVTPFLEGKTIQIVILAIFTGVCFLVLHEKIPVLYDIAKQANILLMQMMKVVSGLIPVAIFLSMTNMIARSSAAELLSVWRVMAVCLSTYAVISLLALIRLIVMDHWSLAAFLGTISPALVVALTTASGSACMATNYDIAKNGLGIDEKLCDFWIPLSHTMFSPGTVAKIIVCAFFAARYNGSSLSVVQLLITLLLAMQLSIASPKIPGGDMASFTLLLTQLGLPLETAGLMMVPCAFLDYIAAAFGMLLRDCELVNFANKYQKTEALAGGNEPEA